VTWIPTRRGRGQISSRPVFAGPWSSTKAAVAAIGAGGHILVHACEQLLGRYEVPHFGSSDLVHGDFRLGNVLLDDHRQLSAVIDIEALGSGTRVFDYATLLDHQEADYDAITLLIGAAKDVAGPAVLAHCFAHVALDLVLFLHRRFPTPGAAVPNQRAGALSQRVTAMSRLLT